MPYFYQLFNLNHKTFTFYMPILINSMSPQLWQNNNGKPLFSDFSNFLVEHMASGNGKWHAILPQIWQHYAITIIMAMAPFFWQMVGS